MLTPEESNVVKNEIDRLIREDSFKTQMVPTGKLLQLFFKLKELNEELKILCNKADKLQKHSGFSLEDVEDCKEC